MLKEGPTFCEIYFQALDWILTIKTGKKELPLLFNFGGRAGGMGPSRNVQKLSVLNKADPQEKLVTQNPHHCGDIRAHLPDRREVHGSCPSSFPVSSKKAEQTWGTLGSPQSGIETH